MGISTQVSPKLTIDPREGTVAGPGGAVRLEPKVMEVLAVLARHPGRVVSRAELMDTVWPDVVVTEHTLTRCIYQLRHELGEIGNKPGQADYKPIETLSKRGYRLVGTVEMSPSDDDTASPGVIAELRRRHLFGVAALYALFAWAATDAAWYLIENVPAFLSWSKSPIALVFVSGFPVAMILAWMYDIRPQGVQRRPPPSTARHRTISIAAGLLIAATAALFYLLYPPSVFTNTILDTPSASIAVLPFDNRSPNSANAYFADGIHDDLLMLLSRLSDLKVVSRTSVERFRDTEESMPQIGRVLGVGYILEGAVQRVDDRIRVNVQLIDAATDDHVWAEAYDRQLTAADLFAIQSEVAEAIAGALQATLSLQDQERLKVVPTDNFAAYEAYLLGKQRMARRTSVSLAEAVDYFRRAIEHDPAFALAYAGLADSYALQVAYSGAPQDQMNAKALAAIGRALQLDSQLGEAHTSLGWLKQQNNDFEGAEASYKAALKLNPSYATIYHWYGNLLRMLGRSEEALALHLKGIEYDPVSASISLDIGNDLERLGRFDEALTQYKKTIEFDSSFSVAYATIADVYWFVYADLAQAARWYWKAIALDSQNPVTLAWLGRLYLDLEEIDEAEYWMNRALDLGPASLNSNFSMALLGLYRNDNVRASQYAEKVLEINPLWFPTALAILRNADLKEGRYTDARIRYETYYPMLMDENGPAVDITNYRAAIDYALVLKASGENEAATRLLDRSLAVVRTTPRAGIAGTGISDVRVYALRGQKRQALARLRQAIDEGWRNNWWYCVDQDPSLASIRDEAEFQSMMAEVELHIAVQLQRVQALQSAAGI